MADEILELDPTSEDSGNTAVLLQDKPNGIEIISHEYPVPDEDWLWASTPDQDGENPVAARRRNREITVVVRCFDVASGDKKMRTRVSSLQQKVGKLDAEQGTLKRTLADSTVIVFDVLRATIDVPASREFHHKKSVLVTLRFTCLPLGRGAEETASASRTESSLPALVWTETLVKGDVPGRGRLILTDAQAVDQQWAIWGAQCRYYSSATTAKLFYEAEALTPLGTAAIATVTGGSGGASNNALTEGTLTPNWAAVMSTIILSGTAYMTHVGTFRVIARMLRPTANTGAVSVRLDYGQGDFLRVTANDVVSFDADELEGDWMLVDLGQVRLTKAVAGSQRWEGRIFAKSTVVGDDLSIDCISFIPVDEGSGEARSAGIRQFQSPSVFSARDEFDQTAGNTTGKTLPVGGTWVGAGDADDFTMDTANHRAQRTAVSDADVNTGRYLIAGTTTFTNTLVQVDVQTSAFLPSGGLGVLARYTDTSNWLRAYLLPASGAAFSLVLRMRVGGTGTILATAGSASGVPQALNTAISIRLLVSAAGRVLVWCWTTGGTDPIAPLIDVQNSALATGGGIASGKAGILDHNADATAGTRGYDNFFVAVPAVDAAIFASQSLEIRHNAAIREDSAGAVWTKISQYEGDYFTVPPAGNEARTLRLIAMAARNDADTALNGNIDDLTGQVLYSPRYLHVPPSA